MGPLKTPAHHTRIHALTLGKIRKSLTVMPIYNLDWIFGKKSEHDIFTMQVQHIQPFIGNRIEQLKIIAATKSYILILGEQLIIAVLNCVKYSSNPKVAKSFDESSGAF